MYSQLKDTADVKPNSLVGTGQDLEKCRTIGTFSRTSLLQHPTPATQNNKKTYFLLWNTQPFFFNAVGGLSFRK